MSRKTIIKVVLVVMLSSMILTACGPQATTVPETNAPVNAAPTAEGPAANTPEAGAPAAAEPVTNASDNISGKITVWCWKAAWADTVVKSGVLDAFLAKYPGVTIDYVEMSTTDLYQKLPMALSAGTGAPDFACVESSHLAQLVSLGGLTDLTEKIQPYINQMNAYKWSDATLDGKYYAMPWDSGPVVMYYRRDVFEKAGLPSDPDSVTKLISNWDNYLTACQTIKDKTGYECFANNRANNDARLYEIMLWQQGLGYYDSDGNVTVDSPENVATLEKMKKFWDADLTSDQLAWTDGWYAELAAGGVPQEAPTLDPTLPTPTPSPAVEPVATLVEAAWMGLFLKSWIAPGTAGMWGVALMPAMQDGQIRSANDGGSNAVIPDQSQNKEAAWALAEFLFGVPENQITLFKQSDFFPSLETTYTDPVFSEPDPFFDNQQVRSVYVDVSKVIPIAYVYGPNYQLMNSYLQTAIAKVAKGEASAQDALKEAADAIRNDTGMP